MKKLTIFFTCITLISFLLSNCSKTSNPIDSEDFSQKQLQKPKKPKPPVVEASITNLSFDEIRLIENDNLLSDVIVDLPATHPVLNLSSFPIEINYEILSSVEIANVKLELRYDANINSDYRNSEEGDDFWLEKNDVIFNDWEFHVEGDNYTNSIFWDGQIYDYGWYPLFDQLASYNYPENYDHTDGRDHYILTISAYSDAPAIIISETVYVWISGAVSRSQDLHVQSIVIELETNKNKITPKTTVTLGSETNDTYLYGRWDGLSNNSALRIGPSVNGVIITFGDTFRKNKVGVISFKVENIVSQNGVYNPWLNGAWLWPERPITSINYPN